MACVVGLSSFAPAAGAADAPAAAAPPRDAAPTLETVQVTANQLGTVTEGSGAYTPGTIATATRLVLSPRQTPQSISVITRQEMDDFALNGIDDVMRVTPGVSIVTYDSERTEYYARGFAVQNFQYDGIPMQRDSAYSAGNTLSDMAIYDRVEVLKGATGLLTGMGDPGATINLVRKKPTRELAGSATLGAGSWDSYRAEVDVGGPLTDSGRVRARAVAAYQDRHANTDHYQRRNNVFYAVLEADLGDDTLLTVGADDQDSDPQGSSWGGIPLLDRNGDFNSMPRAFNNGARWSRWRQYSRTGFAMLEHRFGNDWIAKLQLNHQVNGYDAALGAAAGGTPDPATGEGVSLWLGQYIGKTTSNAADLYLSGRFQWFGREHELVVGGSAARKHWINDGYTPQPGYAGVVADYRQWHGDIPEPDWQWLYGDDQVTRESGAYVVGRFNLADPLKLILGSRIANYRSTDIDESGVVVPYAGVVYDLDRHFSVYASYTSIFKPQSNQDAQGKVLDPQQGRSYEAGLKGEFYDGRLNASAAVFQLDQDNYPDPSGELTPSGGTAYRRLRTGTVRAVAARVADADRLRAQDRGPGWRQGQHAGAGRPVQRAQQLSPRRAAERLDVRRRRALAEQDLRHGPASVAGRGRTPHRTEPYWLLDAMARYQFDERLSATLNVNNLLDKRYYTIFNVYSTYTWGEPRNVRLALRTGSERCRRGGSGWGLPP
ncbi:TonB-dependent siderophore receptor [Xanthomonas graminis]|uniref:TonB-dependent siderophore receptor n=1 Tax=Xanthomonas graminis pv. phlei TaxID=487906 RepID=A0A0K2ZCX5_9XANT|nr:TonB-dependent siderophore receptor [Xanthomonas translucens]CTP83138.1 TonB-dependent siderophore receptor [Xanthomonas translucens pv. phlei]